MGGPRGRGRFAVEHLERLAERVRELELSAVVDAERVPFPGLTVAGTAGCGLIVAGASQYWWRTHPPEPIGALGDPHGVARAIAARLEARR